MLLLFQRLKAFKIVLFLLPLISCSKEEKLYSPPVISIYSPAENAVFKTGDTIRIHAGIADDETVSVVSVTLKSESGQPVLRAADFLPGNATSVLLTELVITRTDLNGRYYIDIKASDKENARSLYRYIQIGSLPLQTDKVFILSESVNATTLYELKDQKLIEVTAFYGDFLLSAFNVDTDQLLSIGRITGGLNAYSVQEKEVKWNHSPGSLPGVPVFADMHVSDNVCFASLEEGKVLGFLPTGEKYVEVLLDNGFKPGKVFLHEKKIIFEQIDKSSGQVRLIVRHYPSGLEDEEHLFGYGRIAAMFDLSDTEILVFSNGSSGQYILRYDFVNNEFTEIDFDTDEAYGTFCRVDENTLVFTKGNDLYKYHISQRILLLLRENYAPDVLRLDESTGLVWCAKDKEIGLIDPFTGNEAGMVKLDKTVSSVAFRYKR